MAERLHGLGSLHGATLGLLLGVALLVAGAAQRFAIPRPALPLADAWAEDARLVAHAGGSVDGHPYTNSREAFQASAEAGYRAIEVDFAETADGRLVVRHDWEASTTQLLGQQGPADTPWTYAAVMRQPILGRYHTLDVEGLMTLLARYPHVRLVTDTKATDALTTERIFRSLYAAAARHPGVAERIVPQLYNEAMAPVIRRIYPVPSFILTLYQLRASGPEVLAICGRQQIRLVTLPAWRFSHAGAALFARAGIRLYVHTLNDPQVMAADRALGAWGFYTDAVRVLPASAEWPPRFGFFE